MKLFLGAFVLMCLLGLTQVHNKYEDPGVVESEFKNLYLGVQPIEHKILISTPTLNDLENGQIVIVSSNSLVKIMFRDNQEIYSIDVSCVTVRR